MDGRFCTACNKYKPLDAEHFHRRSPHRGQPRFKAICRPCANARARAYMTTDKMREKKRKERAAGNYKGYDDRYRKKPEAIERRKAYYRTPHGKEMRRRHDARHSRRRQLRRLPSAVMLVMAQVAKLLDFNDVPFADPPRLPGLDPVMLSDREDFACRIIQQRAIPVKEASQRQYRERWHPMPKWALETLPKGVEAYEW